MLRVWEMSLEKRVGEWIYRHRICGMFISALLSPILASIIIIALLRMRKEDRCFFKRITTLRVA